MSNRRPSLLALLTASTIVLVSGQAAAARSGSNADFTKDGLPNIKSATALVIDLATGAALYERDADQVRPIASISKLFGALVLLDECKLDPEAQHEMSQANRLAARGGDKTKLTTGWSYSHKDLLHAALMRSDNRALPALAEACGLEPGAFAAKMTAKARALGLTKTTFKEPDGLSPENVSTAREVMVALKAAIKIPTLTEIMSKSDYTIVAHKGTHQRSIKIRNTDRLLSKNVATILGGKTGYTDIARYCLAVAARLDSGQEVGMVFLGGEGRFTRFADFTRVVKWLGPARAIASERAQIANAPKAPTSTAVAGAVVPSAAASTSTTDATAVPQPAVAATSAAGTSNGASTALTPPKVLAPPTAPLLEGSVAASDAAKSEPRAPAPALIDAAAGKSINDVGGSTSDQTNNNAAKAPVTEPVSGTSATGDNANQW